MRLARIGYGDADDQEDFRHDVREWLSNGMTADLRYCVDAEITLVHRLVDPLAPRQVEALCVILHGMLPDRDASLQSPSSTRALNEAPSDWSTSADAQ